MSIYRRFTGHDVPALITTNTAGRRPLFIEPEATEAVILAIRHAEAELHASLWAYVLMPDHLHLVLGPSRFGSHGDFVRLVKGRFAHRWNHARGTRGTVWQPRFHERALRTEKALLAAVDYVHNNPVAAGLVGNAGDYPWSSVREYLPHPCRPSG